MAQLESSNLFAQSHRPNDFPEAVKRPILDDQIGGMRVPTVHFTAACWKIIRRQSVMEYIFLLLILELHPRIQSECSLVVDKCLHSVDEGRALAYRGDERGLS